MKSLYLLKPYFQENRFLISLGLCCLIGVDFLQLFIPRVIKWAVDDLTDFRIDSMKLLSYALYILGIALIMGLFRYGWRRCLIGTSRRIEEGLRNTLLGHLQSLSASYFDGVKTGDLMAHATNDVQNIRMAVGMGIVALTDAVVLGAAAIGFMAYINIRLTIFALIPMPVIALGTRFFSKKMHRLYQDVQASFSDLTEAARERFAGIRIIKAFNRQKDSTARLKAISNDYVDRNIKLVRITGSFFPLMIFFTHLSLVIVLFLGGRQTIGGVITAGDFVAFISYIGLLGWPMMAMGWVTNLIQRGAASLDRIDRILKTRPAIQDAPCAIKIRSFKRDLVFDSVSFSYGPDGPRVLSAIDMKLESGGILGIVGPPGSGKTTILSLIPRLYDVSGGRILIDGIDIRKINIRDLRSRISFMPQEPFLFAGTIRENITFGHKKIRMSDVEEAAEKAVVYETIQTFPNAFETVVGERGVMLSGGQKQRIALARALLLKTPLLIMDDPISQVDVETGAAIVKNIRQMAGTRTLIIVSHRLSAVSFADPIIVLDDGCITESGTHPELMASNRYYARTFRLQEVEEKLHAQ